MRYRPADIEKYGLEPYAVYGGFVYSFKCPQATGNRIYDASLLDQILIAAQERANRIISDRNVTSAETSSFKPL